MMIKILNLPTIVLKYKYTLKYKRVRNAIEIEQCNLRVR